MAFKSLKGKYLYCFSDFFICLNLESIYLRNRSMQLINTNNCICIINYCLQPVDPEYPNNFVGSTGRKYLWGVDFLGVGFLGFYIYF